MKRGKSFDVTEAALARVDRDIRAAFLRHERDQLFMICHPAIRASQTLSLPTPTAAPAAQVAFALDPSNFGKGRPSAANGTIAFRPAFSDRRRPAAAACLQKRNWDEERYSLESVHVQIKLESRVVKPLAILTE